MQLYKNILLYRFKNMACKLSKSISHEHLKSTDNLLPPGFKITRYHFNIFISILKAFAFYTAFLLLFFIVR